MIVSTKKHNSLTSSVKKSAPSFEWKYFDLQVLPSPDRSYRHTQNQMEIMEQIVEFERKKTAAQNPNRVSNLVLFIGIHLGRLFFPAQRRVDCNQTEIDKKA